MHDKFIGEFINRIFSTLLKHNRLTLGSSLEKNDVMNALDTQAFSERFVDWVNTLSSREADIIAIDGKTSRRSDRAEQEALHLVSAWASE